MRLDLVCSRVLNFLPLSTQVVYMIGGVMFAVLRGSVCVRLLVEDVVPDVVFCCKEIIVGDSAYI